MSNAPLNKFWDYYEFDDKRWDDVAAEAKLNPFDENELLDYVAAAYGAIIDDDGRTRPEKLGLMHAIIEGAMFMTKCCLQDAAVQWVTDRYGGEVAFELDKAIRKSDTAEQLYKKYDAEFEAEVTRLQKEKDAYQ